MNFLNMHIVALVYRLAMPVLSGRHQRIFLLLLLLLLLFNILLPRYFCLLSTCGDMLRRNNLNASFSLPYGCCNVVMYLVVTTNAVTADNRTSRVLEKMQNRKKNLNAKYQRTLGSTHSLQLFSFNFCAASIVALL